MKFFAIHIEDLESEKFVSATNDQVASWLFLHALCSKLTNGGTIEGAAGFPDRYWHRHSIEKTTIAEPSPLWSWNGGDLTIHPYDIDGQSLFEKKTAGGKIGAARRWERSENGSPNGSPNAPNITVPDITQQDPTQQDPTQHNPPRSPKGEVSPEANMFATWFKTSLPSDMSLQANWHQKFAETYDELVRLDKRTDQEIRQVCQWGRAEPFWQGNFHSPAKLRKRNKDGISYFDLFREKMKSSNKTTNQQTRPKFKGMQEDIPFTV